MGADLPRFARAERLEVLEVFDRVMANELLGVALIHRSQLRVRTCTGSTGALARRGSEFFLGQLEGQVNPLLVELAEALVVGHLGSDLRKEGPADELGCAFTLMNPTELVIRPVPNRPFGIFAAATWFAANIVLPGKTAGTHLPHAR